MKVYSVTKDNPEGIDRFQLFATKELAEAVAKLWVEKDQEENREMDEEAKAHHSQEELDLRREYRYKFFQRKPAEFIRGMNLVIWNICFYICSTEHRSDVH